MDGTPTRGERATPTEEAAENAAAQRTTTPSPPGDDPSRHKGHLTGTGRGPGLGTETPRGHGTKAQAPREGNPTDRHTIDLPDTPARAASPSPHSTDPARHPHLTAPPSHQPATLRPALRTTTQGRLTPTDPPWHNPRPRHTAPLTRSRGGPATGRCGDTHRQSVSGSLPL